MSFQVETTWIEEYKTNVALLAQQTQSRLQRAVTVDTYSGDGGRPVNQIGVTAAVKKTTRHSDTPLISTPHDARWVEPVDYEWADLVDKQDKLRMGITLEGAYTRASIAALMRSRDDEIITAFFADAKTGTRGGTTTPFLTASQQVVHGSVGLTVEKLKDATKILLGNDVLGEENDEEIFCAIGRIQSDNLVRQFEVLSDELVTKAVIEKGIVKSWAGITFIHSQRLAKPSTNRRVPFWAKSGMHLGIWEDRFVDIGPRRDKSMSVQVYVSETIGSTRLEETKVVEIECAE